MSTHNGISLSRRDKILIKKGSKSAQDLIKERLRFLYYITVAGYVGDKVRLIAYIYLLSQVAYVRFHSIREWVAIGSPDMFHEYRAG